MSGKEVECVKERARPRLASYLDKLYLDCFKGPFRVMYYKVVHGDVEVVRDLYSFYEVVYPRSDVVVLDYYIEEGEGGRAEVRWVFTRTHGWLTVWRREWAGGALVRCVAYELPEDVVLSELGLGG
jgi:hypothetical protein